VQWKVCSSAAIERYRWREGVLELVFIEGQMVYDYPCSEMLFQEFLLAPSKGRFVNGVLKPHADSLGWTSSPRPFAA
jgi:hypothetical protein